MKKAATKPTTLRYKGYTIQVCDHAKDHFDIFKEVINGKTKKPYNKAVGYGYKFDEALLRIASEEMSERSDVTTIKGYTQGFRDAVREIKGILAV